MQTVLQITVSAFLAAAALGLSACSTPGTTTTTTESTTVRSVPDQTTTTVVRQ